MSPEGCVTSKFLRMFAVTRYCIVSASALPTQYREPDFTKKDDGWFGYVYCVLTSDSAIFQLYSDYILYGNLCNIP